MVPFPLLPSTAPPSTGRGPAPSAPPPGALETRPHKALRGKALVCAHAGTDQGVASRGTAPLGSPRGPT